MEEYSIAETEAVKALIKIKEDPLFREHPSLWNDSHVIDMFINNFKTPDGSSVDPQIFLSERLKELDASRGKAYIAPNEGDINEAHSKTWHTDNKE